MHKVSEYLLALCVNLVSSRKTEKFNGGGVVLRKKGNLGGAEGGATGCLCWKPMPTTPRSLDA